MGGLHTAAVATELRQRQEKALACAVHVPEPRYSSLLVLCDGFAVVLWLPPPPPPPPAPLNPNPKPPPAPLNPNGFAVTLGSGLRASDVC